MSNVIEQCMYEVSFVANPELEDYIESDKEAREVTNRIIEAL